MNPFYQPWSNPMPQNQPRHKVFVSYHQDNDQMYRNKFDHLFARVYDIMQSWSVEIGDLDPTLQTETVRQKIRDEYLSDSTVTVVLIGTETWKRKHVDWEIGSSLRDTRNNPRSGLLGIILPTYLRSDATKYYPYTIPPRLYDNIQCGFAKIYNWSENPTDVKNWIHEAFQRRTSTSILPDNSYPSFANNRSGDRWY
jgi:hypothetical protein